MDTSLIILLINLLIYIYFMSAYYEKKEIVFAYVQFGVMFPLLILLAEMIYTNSVTFGFVIILLLPCVSIITLIDGIYYNKKVKEKEKNYKK